MQKLKFTYILILAILLGACQNNNVELYNGPSLIHFMGTGSNELVNNTNPVFTIGVGVTAAVDHDRVFDVVIDTENSTAIEGVGFELLTPQITIAAGSVLGDIQVQGLYEGAEAEGSLISLVLSSGKDKVADFKNNYKLVMFKQCDFYRDAFIGRYKVYEHSEFGEFEYEVNATAGSDDYSIEIDGFWGVAGTSVKISFNPREPMCDVPAQFFYHDPNYEPQYQNFWLRSTEYGTYNTCIGSIEGVAYHVYPEDQTGVYWDRGTFDMYKIEQ